MKYKVGEMVEVVTNDKSWGNFFKKGQIVRIVGIADTIRITCYGYVSKWKDPRMDTQCLHINHIKKINTIFNKL